MNAIDCGHCYKHRCCNLHGSYRINDDWAVSLNYHFARFVNYTLGPVWRCVRTRPLYLWSFGGLINSKLNLSIILNLKSVVLNMRKRKWVASIIRKLICVVQRFLCYLQVKQRLKREEICHWDSNKNVLFNCKIQDRSKNNF